MNYQFQLWIVAVCAMVYTALFVASYWQELVKEKARELEEQERELRRRNRDTDRQA